jgi:hypothetical protein
MHSPSWRALLKLLYQVTMFPKRFVNVESAEARFGDRVGRIGRYLTVGDPLADAAVQAGRALPQSAWRAALRVGSTEGAAKLDAATPREVRTFFEQAEVVPAWVDFPTVERGGALVIRTGILSGLVLAARSIVLGYASPAGNKPLILAGGLMERAPKRLNETARYVRGLIVPGGLRRFGDGYAASLHVRLMHAHVRANLQDHASWNAEAWGTPINQHDMVATVLLFSTVLVEGLRTLGVRIDDEEAEAYHHLWRYAGHLMGVDSALLPTSVRDAARVREVIEATQAPPDDDARKLVRALSEAADIEARTEAEKQAAARAFRLLRAAAYLLHGDALAEELGFERSRLQSAAPIARRLVQSGETLAKLFPEAQMRAGLRYWNVIRDQGFERYGTAFLF